MPKQLTFYQTKAFRNLEPQLAHGGDVNSGKRKLYRPFTAKRPLHLVLRASQAKGSWSFMRPQNQKIINRQVYSLAQVFGIKIYHFANSGNHLHLLLQCSHKTDFQNFLRTLTALLSRRITKAARGRPLKKRFWDKLAYTRIVTWGREFQKIKRYITLNMLETLGFLPQRKAHQRASDKILCLDLEGYLEECVT